MVSGEWLVVSSSVRWSSEPCWRALGDWILVNRDDHRSTNHSPLSIHSYRYRDPPHAAEACAKHILGLLEEAMAGETAATLAISGGSSPRLMFGVFAKAPFPWERVHLFWVDERAVPPTDPQSNFKLADDTWLTPAHYPRRNIHRIQAELQPDVAAARYADEIRRYFGL